MSPNSLTDWRTYVAGVAVAALVAWAYWPVVRERLSR